ncbi:MAG: KH domain-containing protein [Coriobacteriales bacterium]|jgi:predicted RNA-binding protein YlqC (UPF0109 family)|nr:KH domain-containing protein [Coriobacteriales bacterium]
MPEQDTSIVALVNEIVTSLVDEPEQVQVGGVEEAEALLIEIKVAPDDVGKVIGRQGRIIKAIRTLARAASSYADGMPVDVEVID